MNDKELTVITGHIKPTDERSIEPVFVRGRLEGAQKLQAMADAAYTRPSNWKGNEAVLNFLENKTTSFRSGYLRIDVVKLP